MFNNLRNRKTLWALIFSFSLVSVCQSYAKRNAYQPPSIKLSSVYGVVQANKKYFDQRIFNKSDYPAFVTTQIVKIENPGAVKERLSKAVFGASPTIGSKAFIINPNSSKMLRIFIPPTLSRKQDQYFRIRFYPVLPTKKRGFTDKDIKAFKKFDVKASVTVSIGFGMVLAVLKNNPKLKISANLSPDGVDIKNVGDSLIVIKKIIVCQAGNKCREGVELPVGIPLKKADDIRLPLKGRKFASKIKIYAEGLEPYVLAIRR